MREEHELWIGERLRDEREEETTRLPGDRPSVHTQGDGEAEQERELEEKSFLPSTLVIFSDSLSTVTP